MAARVLIFYLIRNSGHHAAAKAIEAAIRRADPSARTLCMDPLEYMYPRLSAAVTTNLLFILTRTPELWHAMYDSKGLENILRLFKGSVHRGSDSLVKIIDSFTPTAVVCTQAYPLGLVCDIKRRGGHSFPVFGAVTDFRVHRFWAHGNGVIYVVPNNTSADKLVSLGIKRDNIRLYGIPISPDFSVKMPPAKHSRHRVLVMGGGRGIGPEYSTIKALDKSARDFTIDVIAGLNRSMGNRLAANRHTFRHRIRLRGLVKHVAPLMKKADILISKAGGLTCAEAVSMELPLIIMNPLPGQEAGNTEELVAHGAALHISHDRDLPAVVTMLLENPEILTMMRRRALELAKPKASMDLAEEILRVSASSVHPLQKSGSRH